MAVIKTHRTSGFVLYIGVLITLIVVGLFYLGGQVPAHEQLVADMSQPKFTDLLLYWAYALLVITAVIWVVFGIVSSLNQLKESPKKALGGFSALLGLVALLVITYVIGDGTLLNIPGYEGNDNRPPMLKMTDMWLYSSYVIFIVTLLAMIVLPLVRGRKK
jgi:hypothetical protein